jgi:hypothetical protein
VPITRHDWHGEWNYTIHPEPVAPIPDSIATPAPAPTPPQRPDLLWLHAPELTGLTPPECNDLIDKLIPAHQAQTRPRASGRKSATSLADRVAITLQQQRFSTPTHVLAELVGVSTTAILKAIKHTRPLLNDAGHTSEPTGTTLNTATETREFATRTS